MKLIKLYDEYDLNIRVYDVYDNYLLGVYDGRDAIDAIYNNCDVIHYSINWTNECIDAYINIDKLLERDDLRRVSTDWANTSVDIAHAKRVRK